MADYIVKDTELTSVANAIRTAGGTNSLLSFPNGFVSAVGNISGGGGSSDFSTAEVTVTNNADGPINVYIPFVDSILNSAEPFFVVSRGEEILFNVVLYQNAADCTIKGASMTIIQHKETTGDVEIDGDGFYITGDGTIIIS